MKSSIYEMLWRCPDAVLLPLMRLRSRMKGAAGYRFRRDETSRLYYAEDASKGLKVYVADRRRLDKLFAGLDKRLESLSCQYMLNKVELRSGDLVVDCGAHVGEIGIWAQLMGAKYYGFEPDPVAIAAMRLNVNPDSCDARALSDTVGRSLLTTDTARADSTLLPPSQEHGKRRTSVAVDCITLDRWVDEARINHIRLLKIEAEGWEPEVLRGGRTAMALTDYVVVDAGEERYGESTIPEVDVALHDAGFRMIGANLRRGSFLYRNRTIDE